MPADDLQSDTTLRALYRRLPDEEVPAHLDAAIHAAASREVAKVRQPWWRYLRWQVPVAAMATASLTLVLLRGPLREEARSIVLRAERSAPAVADLDRLAQAPVDELADETGCANDTPPDPPPLPRPEGQAQPLARAVAPAPAPVATRASAPMRQHRAAENFADRQRERASASTPAEGLPFGRSSHGDAPPATEWPFGLRLAMEPADACPRVVMEGLAACSARRAPQGGLLLVLVGDENSLRRQVVAALDSAGWQPRGGDGARLVFVDAGEVHQVVVERRDGGLRLEFTQR